MTHKAHSNAQTETNFHLIALFSCSVLITLVLFFIDEGYYNFNWMTQPGNWIPFVIYVSIFFLSQLMVSRFLLKNQNGFNKTILSIIGGGITTATLLLVIVMLI